MLWLPLLFAAGCATPAKMAYLKDLEYEVQYLAPPAPELTVQAGDWLNIVVRSETPQLAAPFNAVLSLEEAEGAPQAMQYYVDEKGRIDFPVLGLVPVAGKTLAHVRDGIAGEISRRGYIREPFVDVTLDHFSVTVIGDVSNQVLEVKDPSINLLQVIAQSGGVTPNSNLRDVMVVRTVDGKRTAYQVNLQTRELFNSPVFYLRQNDIVYVKQEGPKLNDTGQSAMSITTAALSLGVIISNVLLWTRR